MKLLGEQAKQIFLDVLKRIEVNSFIEQSVRLDGRSLLVGGEVIDLSGYNEIAVVGFGKASLSMGSAIEHKLGNLFTAGILVTDRFREIKVKSQVLMAGHPIPDHRSIDAAQKVVNFISRLNDNSLILFLISGGGSALVELPLNSEVTLEDLANLNQILIKSGANIREINTIRKHLSGIKGGRLGYLSRRSKCVGLYLSDVNSGDMRTIASNPLLVDDARVEDCYQIADKYRLVDQLTGGLQEIFRSKSLVRLPEQWYEDGQQPVTQILAENRNAVEIAVLVAQKWGFRVDTLLETDERPYQESADLLIERLATLQKEWPGQPAAVISGGEVSCRVRGDGLGGRNQEFVLYSASRLGQLSNPWDWAVFSSGSDGIDGNSNAAGASGTGRTLHAADLEGLEVTPFFQNNDSHSFFKQTGGLLVTGPTGNNVRDLRIMLAWPRQPTLVSLHNSTRVNTDHKGG